MKVAFVTDTGTGQTPDYWKEKGIYCLPLQLGCDQETYDEYVDISYEDVIKKMHQKKMMKTSLPKVGLIQDCFEQLKEEGYDTIFAVPICSGLSSTLSTMEMIANQLEMQFIGVDCHVTAVVESHCVELAKQMYEAGFSMEEIQKKMDSVIESADTILLCDDLDHMCRGGRLTPMAAALGGLLKIKPVLHVNKRTQGRVDVFDKVRTMKKAQGVVINHILEEGVNNDYTIIIAHVDAYEGAIEYRDRIKNSIPDAEYEIIDLVSAVGIHTGLGCLALQVFKKETF
ncbi:MAG: DegV family protein [Holdemanella sp.]|nr:DegV family protein [Holdemanella sp.]